MGYSPEEQRQKEIIKSAVVEALEQHQGWRTKPKPRKSTAKVIALWVLILVTAVGLYNLVAASTR
jgi:hypothetical protein